MADPTNGNGAGLIEACGAQTILTPILANGRPGTVFGPDPNFFATGATPASTVFPRMTQFLAADPTRVGLYLRSQFSGVRITTVGNGQGVSILQTMGNSPGAGGQFEMTLWAPQLMIASPWFYAVADSGGPPTALDQLLTWIEFFKA
jgi:hypothetical protein